MSHITPQKHEFLSSDDQWYVSRSEREFGPLRFGDLAQYAEQGPLLKYDWIWKPGLLSWVAAGEISGLFPEPSARQLNQNSGKPSNEGEIKPNLKTKAKEQIRGFALMFLYLWSYLAR